MGHIITDLKETFRRGNTFIRLIYINVGIFVIGTLISRSEERRVGKECRSRWSPYH